MHALACAAAGGVVVGNLPTLDPFFVARRELTEQLRAALLVPNAAPAPRAAAAAAAPAPVPEPLRRGKVAADVRAYFAKHGNGTLPDLVERLYNTVEHVNDRAAQKLLFWLEHHRERDGANNLDALCVALRAFADVAAAAQAWLDERAGQ